MKKFYFLILAFTSFVVANAQVVVTPPAPLVITDCSFPTTYSPLGDITITETATNDISGTGDFILTAPANFEFQPGIGTVTGSSSDVTIGTATITATTITFTISVSNTAIPDVITISGLQVRGINTASGPSNIVRTASSGTDAVVAGDAAGGGVNHGALTSALYPSLVAGSVAASQTICYNTIPAAFTSITLPTGGTGSYTYQWQSSPDNITWTDIGGATATTYAPPGALTATTYYRRNETSGTCVTVSSNVITITVDANLLPGSVAASQTICYNTIPVAFTSITLPTGGTGSYTYQWQSSPDNITWTDIGGATATAYAPPGVLTATTYYRRNETSGTCGTVSSNVITITVDANLLPGTVAASQTICYNTIPAAFTSTTLPTGGTGSYTYQWQSSPDNITFTDIGGATATTYAPGALTATTYYRRNETSGTCGTVSSNVITITVDANLLPGSVAASQTICYNTIPAAFTSTTLPTGGTGTYTYQWQSSPDNITFTNIGGATATTYAPGALTATTYYRRNETSGICGTVSSNVITITVNANLLPGSVAASQTICYNTIPAAFTSTTLPTGGTGSYTYQWQSSPDNITFTDIGGATATTNAPGALTATTYYRRNETSGTCGTVSSNVIKITVDGNLIAGTVAASQTICYNTIPAAFTNVTLPTGGSGTYTYQWQSSPDNSTWTDIGGATATTYAPGALTATTYYRRNEISGASCGTVSSNVITITVNPFPTVNAVSNQTVCNGSSTTAIAFTGAVAGTVYNWTNNTPSIGLLGSGTGNIASFTGTNGSTAPVTATITVTPSYTNGVTCAGTPVTFTITVNPTALVTVVPNQTVCNNAATTAVSFITTATGATSIIYNWTNNTPSIGLAASGSGNIASFTATNAGTAPVTATIGVAADYTFNGVTCTGPTRTFTITVNPTATINTVPDQTVCNNASTSAVTFSSPTTGGLIVYNWTNSAPSIGLAASGTGNIASFTALNAGTAPVTATITITPSYTNGATCAGTPTTFNITVNPKATVAAVPNQSICNGAPTTAVNFTSPTTGGSIVYNWTNNTPSIGLPGSGSGNIASFTAINLGTSPVTATITVTPSYTNGPTCTGTPTTFTITVNPTATVTPVTNQTVCNNAATTAVTFSSPTTGGTIVYNWTNNTPSIGLAAGGTGNISSFTATNGGTAPVTATITVTPSYTNGATCTGTPTTFTITVNPTATVNAVSDQTVCNGSNTTAVTFSSPTTGGSIVYNWTNSAGASIGLAASGTGNLPVFTAVNAGVVPIIATITVTPSYTNGVACTGTPISFTITINPTATITTPPNQALCNGATTAAVNFSGPVTWTNNAPSIGLTASGVGNIASFTAVNAGTTVVTATISATPTANGCTGNPVPFTITVNPTPTVTAVPNQAYCKGATALLTTLSGPVTGTTFTWTNSNPAIGLAAGGSGNVPSFTATNATTAPISATITITPTANSCTGTTSTYTITVNPTPTVTAVPNQIYCSGVAAPVTTLSGPVAGTTFTWANDNPAIGLAAGGPGNVPSFTAANGTALPVIATITVTPTANSCAGTPITYTITVNPKAIINNLSDSACSGTAFSVTPVDGTDGVIPAGTTYTWSAPAVPAGLTGGAAGSGTSITGTLTNSTTFGGLSATYTVTPTSGGCVGTPFTVTVKVFPYPPKQFIDFFQTNVKSQQLCIGAQVGGGGQNDLDVEYQNGLGLPAGVQNGQPANLVFDNAGVDWDWQYATGNPVGPTVPFSSSPGTTTTHYQHVLPPVPSVFSPIGDYWFRFSLSNNGCTIYSDTIHLQVTSTLVSKTGGPYVRCFGSGSFPLTGSSVNGTTTALGGITGQWVVLTPGGTVNNGAAIPAGTPAGNANLSAVLFTPTAGFSGTVKIVLKSNAPGGGCQPAADTTSIIILPLGNLQGCTAPANWQLVTAPGNGSLDQSQVPCAATLVGSDNNSGTTVNTDFKICAGAGNFSFNWVFTAPRTGGATPIWHTADQQVTSGAGTTRGSFVANKPTNLVAGDLIVVILHARDNVGSIGAPDGFSSIRKDVGGNSGNTNRGAVYTYWKIATASEPASYSFQANSMANNDDWVAVAGRVTGADQVNPIDASNGANSNTSSVTSIVDPAITTLGSNRLIIASVSVGDDDHGVIAAPGGLTTLVAGNSGLGKQITYGDYFQNFPTAGTTTPNTFSWSASDPAATQSFAILPAGIPDDSAFVIVNGVQTLISGTSGTLGTFSIPVNSSDVIGLRVKTTTNTGGPGRLTFYNVNIPNDTPKVTGTSAITIPACNPAPATIAAAFITPTVTDNCAGTPSLVAGYPQTGSVVSTGCSNSQTKTWLYVDNCGLQSKPFVQTVTWTTDNVKPVLTCAANQSFCTVAGNNYTIPVLTATDNCIGGITYSYSITGATTRSGIGNDASGNFSPGVSTITWTATDGCGNFGNCATIVTIAAPPTATISGTATICSGASATISVTLTGTAPWSITYTNGGAPVTVNGILTSPYTFSTGPLVSNTTYTLTAVSDSRCTGTFSGSAAITVRPVPNAVISGSTTICNGGSATISIAPTGTAPWSVTYTNGVTPVTVNNILSSPYTFVVSPATTTTYTITAFSDVNCSGTFSGSAVITVNPKPTVLINGANPASATVCLGGGGVALTASGATTYSWSPAAGLSATTGATVTANPGSTTTYTVTGTDGNGCVNTATVTVTVNIPPVTTGVTICQGGSGVISSSTVCANGTFTSGPNNAGTGTNFDAGNTYDWINPNNITTPGSPYATNTIGSGSLSNYLLATNYGFAIPGTATILGIKVDINGAISDPSGNVQISDLFLVKDISIPDIYSGTASGVDWPLNSAFRVETYGSSADLWAGTWTPAEINNPNFGFIFDLVNNGGSGATALADYVKISVTYSVPGSLNWYTVSSGGSSIGSGSPFNPVGVLGSGLPDTNTPGTYPFYAECTTAPGCRTVTNFVINPLPTITPAPSSANVCLSSSAQNTSLTYSATNAPTTYSITWNAAATSAGFTPVTNAALPASPITISVPANAPVNTYTGTITVKNANGCISASGTNFTVTVDPVTVGGTLPSVSVCASGSGTLTLTGNVGSVIHWESSTDGGTTWNIIVNNTTTLTYSASPITTLYRVLVQSGACSSAYSTVSTVGIHNVWTGVTSIDWNDGTNWSDGTVPTTSCPDVFVPGGTPFEPTLSGAPTATITNLHILAGGFLTVNGTGLLQIGGTISNGGVFDALKGAVEFNSTTASQTIAANTFMNNAIHNLIISNSNAAGVSLAGPLNVFGSLTFSGGGTQLVTNNNLTLKSTATETASLGNMTGRTVTGNVTVERYIATGTAGAPNHGKSWQLLAVPTQGQTIKASWQEGATATNVSSPAPGSTGNPLAGYGTMLTSDVAGAATQPSPGFDALTTPGPSVKVYDYTTTLYVGPPNTNLTQVYNQKGYFVFVRGDRSVFTSGGAATPTILRTKGTLFTPANPPPTTTVFAGKFESVGNPYASAIDMRSITLGGGTQQFFIVWDPRLGGAYNYGAFQTLGKIGPDYYATPGGGSYGFGPVNLIQSGQAFFVQASGSNGTVSFTEAAKANGSSLFTTPNPVNQVQHTLRTSLNTVNADGSTGSIIDGVLSQFDDTYSNDVDGMDARKMINTGENLSIKTAGKLLAIESRYTITGQDTIFFNITNERVQPYRFHFDAENLDPTVHGFLVDSYTNIRTPINMTGGSDVNFSIATVTGSTAANRFMIVFEPLKALPVTFTSLKAYRQGTDINIEWKVANERNMKQYEVEKSTDGTSFNTIAVKAAIANNGGTAGYIMADVKPAEGYNYYRIRTIDINGKSGYTNVVKVLVADRKPVITINPNPITDGIIHLQLVNQPVGRYGIRLLNKLGQLIVQKQISHAAGSSTELIKWDYNLAHGMYQLEITRPDGSIKDLNVMY